MPASAVTMHARRFGRPSTTTRQSKQIPIPQKSPRGLASCLVVLHDRTPSATSAAPMLWPAANGTARPSKSNVSLELPVALGPSLVHRSGASSLELPVALGPSLVPRSGASSLELPVAL